MSTCTYCKSTIPDAATRCPFCTSELSGDQSGRYVHYIVDRDLIRFAKLIGGAIALFATLGIYLFGIDMKDSHKALKELRLEIEGEAKAAQTAASQAKAAVTDVATATAKVQPALKSIEQTQRTVAGLVDDISKRKDQIDRMAVSAGENVQRLEKAVKVMIGAPGSEVDARARAREVLRNASVRDAIDEWVIKVRDGTEVEIEAFKSEFLASYVKTKDALWVNDIFAVPSIENKGQWSLVIDTFSGTSSEREVATELARLRTLGQKDFTDRLTSAQVIFYGRKLYEQLYGQGTAPRK